MPLIDPGRLARGDTRRAVGAAAVSLALLAASVWQLGVRERDSQLRKLENRLVARVGANADVLRRQIEDVRRDVQFLASVPPVDGLVRATTNAGYDAPERTTRAQWMRRLESIFRNYALANPDIFQVRLIGVADGGRELLRVERVAGKIVTASPGQLQAQGGDADFQAAVRLPAGRTDVSDITLYRERGQLARPYRPTLRVATPVIAPDGQVFGALVIHFDASVVLAPLRANLPLDFQAFLTNAEGDFLLHPDPAREFGVELGRRWRWNDQFHLLAQDGTRQLRRYALAGGGDVYALSKTVALDAGPPARALGVTLAVDAASIERAVLQLRLGLLAAMLGGAAIVGAAGWLYSRQRRQIWAHQATLSAIVESAHDAIIGQSLDGLVVSWNPAAERMFGYQRAAALGARLSALIVPPEVADQAAAMLRRAGAGELLSGVHLRLRQRAGQLLDVAVSAAPIRASAGHVVGIAVTLRDVGEQLAAELRIHELNDSLERQVRERTAQVETYAMLQHAILADAGYAIIVTDAAGLIRLFNPAAERMLGYSADEVLGLHTPTMLLDPAELQAYAAARARQLGEPVAAGFDAFVALARRDLDNEAEWTCMRKDGSHFPMLLSIRALRASDASVEGYLGIGSDVSVRKQDRRLLMAALDQLQNAADVAELGIWTWNLADNTLVWNARMYQFYDVAPPLHGGSIDYQSWRERVHPDDVTATEAALAGAVAGSAVYDPVFRVRQRDASWRVIQAAATVERDDKGKALRVMGINRDITAQREVEQAMRVATAAAQSANRAKSEFLANMSHEIRSPMNAVLGMLTLLKQTALAPRQLDYANKAEGAGQALLAILNDILDFSRVEAGKMALDPHPFSLDKLLREVAVILSAQLRGKDIDLLYQVDPALPDWLVGDPMRLQQVLINLAGNALKFTRQGEVVVSVRLLGSEQGGAVAFEPDALRLGFAVRDSGIGISPEQCLHIFDGFSQAEASTARRYGGSGLGLAISQRLVRLMGGTLSVESVVGRGSIFSFELRCRRAPATPARARRPEPSLRALNCLVVDDHDFARALMVDMLTCFGWQATAAASGADALALLGQADGARFDAIFIDWRMPDMDGWETSARIRALLPRAAMPLIFMITGHGQEVLSQRHAALPVMLDGFLVKPVTASMLLDTVLDALADKTDAGMHAELVVDGQARLAGLRLLLVEDNLMNQQVACELLSHEGASVTVVDGGQAAIEAVCGGAVAPFDCVLMDVQMPDMDGYAATRAIRTRLSMTSLPIIAMTANALPSDRAAALEAGMNDHVGKPFDLSRLVVTILVHCARAAPGQDVARADAPEALHAPTPAGPPAPTPAGPPAHPGASADPLEHGAALARFGGNLSVYRLALRGFAPEQARLLDALPARADQLTMTEARKVLHTLKGLAGTVGAHALAGHAARLEQALLADGWERRWDSERAALARAAQQAGARSSELELELGASAPPAAPGAVLDAPMLRAALAQLHTLLSASNLDALALFATVRRDVDPRWRARFFALGEAIDQCEFTLAARLCSALLDADSPIP